MNIKRKLLDVLAPKEIKDMMKFLDGKKALIGVLITVAPDILKAVGEIVSAAGGDSAAYAKVTGGIIMVLGILHKFVKA